MDGIGHSSNMVSRITHDLDGYMEPKPYEPVLEKTNNLRSDQVRHKPGCTVTEHGSRLEISDLSRRGTLLSV